MTPPNDNPNAGYLARRATNGYADALQSPLVQGGQIMSLGNVSPLSTDTAVTLVIDPGLSTQEVVIGWVDAGNTVINMARGVEGADQPHAQGAIVMDYQTAAAQNGMVDFVLADHNPDGTHHASFLVGEIRQWPASALPDAKWLVCDGSSQLRTAYASLYAILGTRYGSADSTHFNLPDYRGRTLVGQDTGQSEFAQIGQTGGEKTHTLILTEMPSHNHIQDPHTHQVQVSNVSGYGGTDGQVSGAGIIDTSHTSGFLATATIATNQATGGGQAHNNLQPYAVANYIIRALA